MPEDLPQPVVANADLTAPAALTEASDPNAVARPPQLQPEIESALPLEAQAEPQPAAEMVAGDLGEAEMPPTPGPPAAAAPGLSPAACGAKLIELFPALFAQGRGFGPMKPMKLRIQADLQQRAPGVFSRRTLGIFFSRYTTGNAYLKALTLAPHRFDLDGQPAGEISDEHRRLAAEELARRHALAAERRAAQRPASAPPQAAPTAETPTTVSDHAAPSGPSEPRHALRAQGKPQPQMGARRDLRPPQRHDLAPPSNRHPPSARPGRPDRPQRDDRNARSDRGDRREQPAPSDRMPPPAAAPPVPLPVDPAQRERALLLRAYDASPLSKANFCALKGLNEADLDAALAQAQAERSRR